ncbi:hypothetical protein JOC34_000629 [Virgibacillus halotolerans]|nr:hypothetical protein [Virgibacillus halotolerans]MBM7598272.1 hypothetical protein [Virgibacillus halotolerans]
MEKMMFHWEDNNGNTGKFKVSSFSVEDCIKTANTEVGSKAEIIDYYSI